MTTLFEQFYNASDEVKAAVKKPFVRRKLKLRFQSALASLSEKEAALKTESNEISQKVEELNINRLLEIADEIDLLKKDRSGIRVLYKDWFGKEMKDIDDDESD